VHGLTQVCVVVDGERYDVSLPAGRPVVEFLADLLVLTGRWGGEAHGWGVRPVGAAAPVPLRWTLDDAQVRDGAVLLLERDGAVAVAGDRVVDNLAGTVADVVAARAARGRAGSGVDRPAVSGVLAVAGCAVLIAPAAVAPLAGPTGGVLSALLALALTILAATASDRSALLAGVAAPGAAVHAALSAWASTDSAALDARLAFALAAGGIVALALAAVVEISAVRAGLVGVGLAAVAGAALAGASAITGWPPGPLGLLALGTGLVVLAGAGQLGFRSAGVPRLDRMRPTESEVRNRVELGRLLVSAFHLTAAVLVVAGSALVFAGDDPRRWAVAGLAGVILVVRTRACPELGQLVPLAVGVFLMAVAFAVQVVGPRAGWVAVYLGSAGVGAVLVTLARQRPALRPLVRRRLGKVELVLAVACVPAILFAADVLGAVFEMGRRAL
jgi:hypothetical protein